MKKGLKKMIFLGALFVMFGSFDVQAAVPQGANASEWEWEVLKIANEERAKQGKEGLSTFTSLQKAAGIRAEELTELFSHTRPDGSSCFTALADEKIRYYSAGENIAGGQSNPANVMNAWMNSEGHRANILGGYKHLGVGHTTGGQWRNNWAQLFVGGCTIEGIKVDGVSKDGYEKGKSIDSMDLYLTVTCNMHGTAYIPLQGQMCSGYDASKSGTQKVKVTYSGLSASFNITIKGEGDTGTETEVKKPAKVTGLKVKKASATKIKVTWKKKDADGYVVYMKTGNGKYKKVKTINKETTTSYTTKKLKKGKKYSFKVRAYNKSGNTKKYGKYSAVKSIKL